MSRGGGYWDNFEKDMYDMFFHEADNIQHIYRDQGLPVAECPTPNKSYSYGDNYRSNTSDEAIARCLQEMEDGLANFSFDDDSFGRGPRRVISRESSVSRGHGGVQDDVNPDEMTYEEISELGQAVGNVKKGLTDEQISRLPTHTYNGPPNKKGKSDDGDSECVICKMQYRKKDVLMTLPCAHKYHEECIRNWLKEDKSCCVCKAEVAV